MKKTQHERTHRINIIYSSSLQAQQAAVLQNANSLDMHTPAAGLRGAGSVSSQPGDNSRIPAASTPNSTGRVGRSFPSYIDSQQARPRRVGFAEHIYTAHEHEPPLLPHVDRLPGARPLSLSRRKPEAESVHMRTCSLCITATAPARTGQGGRKQEQWGRRIRHTGTSHHQTPR